jgi:hypothetical protein
MGWLVHAIIPAINLYKDKQLNYVDTKKVTKILALPELPNRIDLETLIPGNH